MAHHLVDQSRLRLLTQGADTGGPRLYDYESNADEDEFIEQLAFWAPARIRPGSWIQIYGTGKLALNIYTLTRSGPALSGLDVFLDRLRGAPGQLPDAGPIWDDIVRDSVCRTLGCGG